MVYVALASALACRVLRMGFLCETETEGDDVGGGGRAIGAMGGTGSTPGTVQFARRSSVNEDVWMRMGPVRTIRRVG